MELMTTDFCCGITSVGRARDHNEDAFYISPNSEVMVVADGVGGSAAGEVASALAIDEVGKTLLDADGNLRFGGDLNERLLTAVVQSHDRIRSHAAANAHCAGMATALIVGVVQEDRLALAHVGDVRAYRYGRMGLQRLTEDHSVVAQLIREGLLTEAAAATHDLRHRIWQAVGSDRPLRPDIALHELLVDDLVLLCSDGLWDQVPDSLIAETLGRSSPVDELATTLVDHANLHGGTANITVIVYRHGPRTNVTRPQT